MDLQKYRKLFLEEARAHLQELDGELVAFERSPDAALLDSLFRHAHSIKGMAASMGYDPVVDIAHALEDLLTQFRDTAHTPSAGTVSLLLAAADALGALVDQVEADTALSPRIDLVARLQAAAGKAQPAVAPAAEPAPPPVAAAPEAPAAAATDTAAPQRLVVRFSALAALPAARAFQVCKLLEPVAVQFDPPVDEIRGGKFKGELRVALRAAADQALLAKVRAVPDVEAVELSSAPAAAAAPAEHDAPLKRLEMPSQIRIDTAVLDRFVDMVGELVTVNNQIRETSRGLFSEELLTTVDALGRITGNLYQQVLQARMVPFSLLAERLPRAVRDLAMQLGKEVQLTVEGNDVELDRSVMENLGDPLMHLVRNALDHGIEPPAERAAAGKPPAAKLKVSARQQESMVAVEIADDGRGIDRKRVIARALERGLLRPGTEHGLSDDEVYDFLFRAGFSTAAAVSNISGRGVGLDVVKSVIENLGGEIQILSTPGRGTTFRLRLPARVAIIPVFLVRAGEQTFGLPIAKVSRARWINRADVQNVGGREAVLVDGRAIPYHTFSRLLGIQESFEEKDEITVFEVERGASSALLSIDAFIEEREVYLKTAPRPLDRVRGLLGLTLVRGEPVFILDPGMMIWNYV